MVNHSCIIWHHVKKADTKVVEDEVNTGVEDSEADTKKAKDGNADANANAGQGEQYSGGHE